VTTAFALRHSCVVIVLHALVGCEPPAPRSVSDDGWGPSSEGAPAPPPQPQLDPAPRLTPKPPAQRTRFEIDPVTLDTLGGVSASEHGQGLLREVRINQLAERYRHSVDPTPFPAGALIVQRHHRAENDATVSSYAMLKRDDGWEFLVLDADWRVALRGKLTECERCHADAPFDGTFGPPPPTEP
jgi:hypothetical protein